MATVQLSGPVTIDGTTYPAAKLIVLSPQQQKTVQHILPKEEADDGQGVTQAATGDSSTKRRIHFSRKAINHPRPQSVTRRNTRERNRVRAVNQSFVTLASHVPPEMRGKKMSKVDTLQAAIMYIKQLRSALNSEDDVMMESTNESAASPGSSYSDSVSSGSIHSDQSLSPAYQPHCSAYTAPYSVGAPDQISSYSNFQSAASHFSNPTTPLLETPLLETQLLETQLQEQRVNQYNTMSFTQTNRWCPTTAETNDYQLQQSDYQLQQSGYLLPPLPQYQPEMGSPLHALSTCSSNSSDSYSKHSYSNDSYSNEAKLRHSLLEEEENQFMEMMSSFC